MKVIHLIKGAEINNTSLGEEHGLLYQDVKASIVDEMAASLNPVSELIAPIELTGMNRDLKQETVCESPSLSPQTIARTSTLIEKQATQTSRNTYEPPWTRPWWQPSAGNVATLIYIVMIHILALVGLILFPLPGWPVLTIALVIAAIGGVGTTVCYHRCLAHRTVRLNPVIEKVMIFFSIFNASGAPLSWVAQHRNHHAKADTSEDISSPRYGGFWWAHIRWVYQWSGSDVRRWCPDMNKLRYRIWRPLQIPIILLSIFSGLVLSWEGFFWIGAIRLVYVLHFQMFVNSLLHMTPGLPDGVDSSRNLWWLGPLQLGAWGENWHRNHHQDANAARFGRKWWQIDLGWYVICLLKILRLASDIRLTKEQRKLQHGLKASVTGTAPASTP